MNYKELKTLYKSSPATLKPNKLKFPENLLPTNEDGAENFNEILDCIHEMTKSGKLRGRIMPLTPSGGIKITPFADHQNTYAITATNSMIEVLLCAEDYFRFYFRRNWSKENKEMSGLRSFHLFCQVLKKFGHEVNEFFVPEEEGKMYKDMIPAPLIDINEMYIDETLENIHHLDIHSSHMAGVAEAYKELSDPINYMYVNRKTHPGYKSVLTHAWGYFQSRYVKYRLSHLSLAGLQSTNRKIKDLTKRLESSGRKPIMRNTDGIWYQGEIYHGEGEGTNLGEWSNDHINCKFRAKSKGTYEYIENGVYTPVARGPRELDKIKPRDNWEWGDIYKTGSIPVFYWDDENERLIKEELHE